MRPERAVADGGDGRDGDRAGGGRDLVGRGVVALLALVGRRQLHYLAVAHRHDAAAVGLGVVVGAGVGHVDGAARRVGGVGVHVPVGVHGDVGVRQRVVHHLGQVGEVPERQVGRVVVLVGSSVCNTPYVSSVVLDYIALSRNLIHACLFVTFLYFQLII